MAETKLDRAVMNEQQADILARRTAGAGAPSMDLLNYILSKEQDVATAESARADIGGHLTSTAGIATGIAALLAAAFGGQQGAQAATGLATGFGQGAGAAAQQEQAQLQQEAAVSREELDRARNALNMVYQANPESFMDATGEMTVNSSVLGYALTGLPISVSPTTEYQLRTRTDARKAQIDAAHEAFLRAEDVDGRKRALSLWNGAGQLGWTADDIDVMAGAKSLDDFFLKIMPYSDVGSVLDAILATSAAGITDFSDKRLVPIFNGIAARAAGAGGRVPQKWEVAGDLITRWVLEDFPNRSQLSPTDQVEQALATQPDLLLEYQNRYEDQLYPDAPITLREYTEIYSALFAKAITAAGTNPAVFEAITGGDLEWAFESLRSSVDAQVEKQVTMRETQGAGTLSSLVDYGNLRLDAELGDNATVQDFLDMQNLIIKMYSEPGSIEQKKAGINDWLRSRKGK